MKLTAHRLIPALLSISASAMAADNLQVVKIGSAAPTTGANAAYGKENENGARLAVDDANKRGLVIAGKKIQFELDAQDDAGDPRQGTQVAQRLIDDGVVAVVGHLNSGVSIVASRLYHDAQIPQISPSSTNPQFTLQGFNTTYRMVATDAEQSPALANYASHTLKARRFAVVDDATAYGQGLADQFVKAADARGKAVVVREQTSDKTLDFKAVLTHIKSARVDAIFYGGMDATGGPFARQARELALNTKILGGDGVCSEQMVTLARQAADNVICTTAGLPISKMKKGNEFANAYEKRFGVPMLIYAPYAYDAVMVLIDAMRRADSTNPKNILATLPSENYQGLIGDIRFDRNGDVVHPMLSLYQFKEGEKILIDVISP